MREKKTDELLNILKGTHTRDISSFLQENKGSMITDDKRFSSFFRECLKKKQMRQQDVFLLADIPERYGYKLVSMEKKTLQRDTILRLCYAGQLSLEETQTALKYYGMPQLYPKIERDAVLMICFNERPGSIIDINVLLKQYGLPVLRSSGAQD